MNGMNTNKKRNIFVILFSIILLSVILRVYGLDSKSLWLDEGHSMYRSEMSIKEIITYLEDIHPPLYFLLLHAWTEIFGNDEFSSRLLSVLFGIISIFIIYKIGKELFNKEIGILSSFLLGISLFHIRYSQEVRQYSLMVLLVLISNLYFILFFKNKEIKSATGYILSTSLLIYTHMLNIFVLIYQNIFYIYHFRKNKSNIKFWICNQIVLLLMFTPWIYTLAKMPKGTYQLVEWLSVPTLNDLSDTFVSFSNNSATLLLLFVLLLLVSVLRLENQMFIYMDNAYKNEKIFLLLWLFLPIISLFAVSLFKPLYYDRYVIYSVPALYILASYGIYKMPYKKIMIVAIIMVIIGLSITPLWNYYFVEKKEQWREMVSYIGESINDSQEKDNIILLYPSFIKDPFEYYYNKTNKKSGIRLFYTGEGTRWVQYKADNRTTVWLVYYHFLWSQQMKSDSVQFLEELNRTYAIKYRKDEFEGITLYRFDKKG